LTSFRCATRPDHESDSNGATLFKGGKLAD